MKLLLAFLCLGALSVEAQTWDSEPWHHHRHNDRGSTIITPDGPIFITPQPGGGAIILGPDGPSFFHPNRGGGGTIIGPDGPIFISPN